MYAALSETEEFLGKEIVDISYRIHSSLGPGLLESVYEKCFAHELSLREIPFRRQKSVPIYYNGLKIDDGLRLDLVVADCVIIELKAQQLYHPVWNAQMLSYLKLSNIRLGFIVNFHVPLIKEGIKRIIR